MHFIPYFVNVIILFANIGYARTRTHADPASETYEQEYFTCRSSIVSR